MKRRKIVKVTILSLKKFYHLKNLILFIKETFDKKLLEKIIKRI
ncbi:MAG: hypothetical protein ACP5H3_00805 [Candidatus Aenigmatarchaeota archaeon]